VSEKRIMQQIMKALSDAGSRLFRNHVGIAYQGKVERFREATTVKVSKGDIVIRNARTTRSGLATGSSDLVGWTTRMITEHDLGKTIAQFTACEVKTQDGESTPEQQNFLEVVRDSGGVAILARSADEAVSKLRGE
jgi:hypothetical protein